MKSGDSACSR